MKKVLFYVCAAAVCGSLLSSCGNKAKQADTDTAVVEEVAVATETDTTDTLQQQAGMSEIAMLFADPANASATPTDKTYATTPSGLKYLVVREGNGKKPGPTDEVTVNYEGQFLDGNVFDSSYERGEPTGFPLNRVIPGWTEGLQLMKEGGKAIFYIPWQLAYGEQGYPGVIPEKADLIFTVELLGVNR